MGRIKMSGFGQSYSLLGSCTMFKRVSDIVLLDKNGFVNVVTLAKDVYSCLVQLASVLVLVEVGQDHYCVKGLAFVFPINLVR